MEVEVIGPPTNKLDAIYPEPCTENRFEGDDVPTPTLPLEATTNIVLVAVPPVEPVTLI